MKVSYIISSKPYYDSRNESYCNILAINREPIGPLASIVRRINPNKLSDFQTFNNDCCGSYTTDRCIYAIKNICDYSNCDYLSIDNISELFTFLMNNGYTIDTSLTNIMRKAPLKTNSPLMFMIMYEYE